MVCIYCTKTTQVINSRLQKRSNSVWRRRRCLDCQAVFTTIEAAEYDSAWRVVTAANELVPFRRDQLFLSIYNSCQHRPDASTDATALTDTVIQRLQPQVINGAVAVADLRAVVKATLELFDAAASVHYQAFHRG